MWSISMILKHVELALRLHAAVPSLAFEAAYAHAEAASAAATPEISAELLLGIAFVESRFDVTAVSRVEGQKRKTGPYRSTTPPARLDRRASLYCGPLQTYAPSWRACLEMRDLRAAYTAGAHELAAWLRDRRVRGDKGRALAGHGCGNFGVTTGVCNGYPERVLWMARRIQSRAAHTASARRAVPST